MGSGRSLTRSLALPAILVVAMSACSKGATPEAGTTQAPPTATSPSESGPTGSGVSGGDQGDGAGVDDSSGGDGSQGGGDDGGSQPSTTDDLQVFGFATSDEAQLAGEVADVSETVARLAADSDARDLSAAQADAAKLGTSAELEAAYEDLNRELTSWAQDHPAAAAEALARFAT